MSSNSDSESDTETESEYVSVSDSETENYILNQNMNCINYDLCHNYKYKHYIDYCKSCFIYNNFKIHHTINILKKTCPICLSNDNYITVLKLFLCNHIICYNCIKIIYWTNITIFTEIQFPVPRLKFSWDFYIKSIKSNYIKKKLIYKILNNTEFINNNSNFDILYNRFINNIKIIKVPKLFNFDFKKLIFYQVHFEKFYRQEKNNKYTMHQSIKCCPYCREGRINYE